MKKVFITMLMLLAALMANAQGKWEKTVVEGDELKGTVSGEAYVYTVPEMGSFIFWGFDNYQFRLVSEEQFNIIFSGGWPGVILHVGLYDDNDKLINKFNMWLDREDNHRNRFARTRNAGINNPVGQKGNVKKIFKALQSGSGYVRLLTERFDTTDFDIKIPPFNLK